MPNDNAITAIAKDGLRYKSKQGGSPFGASSSVGVMSCYKCGRHKARALGSFKTLLGQSMFVCGDCRPIPEKGAQQAEQVNQVGK